MIIEEISSRDFLAGLAKTRTVLIPVGASEEHGDHLPIGTDFINGVERCKLIAQERDILVAPVLMVGQSPYHMGFAGTIALSADTIIKVHLEAVESLIRHGFKRFIIMNAHGGNRAITTLLVDQINQELLQGKDPYRAVFDSAGEPCAACLHGGNHDDARHDSFTVRCFLS